MTYSVNNFMSREKQLQKLIKADERFLEFLKDKDVKRKTLVDEKGRKMDIKGSVDLKKKYGLTNKDLKVKNVKKSKDLKKVKKENCDNNTNNSNDDQTTTIEESHLKSEEQEMEIEEEDDDHTPIVSVNEEKMSVLPTSNPASTQNNISETNLPDQSKDKRVNKINNSFEPVKKAKPEKKVLQKKPKEMKMSKGALERFKKMMAKNLEKDDEEEMEEVAEDKIHKEFTFTVSGDATDDEYSDDEMDQQISNKKKERHKKDDKKCSEAEKTDLLLLTMDTNSIKESVDSIMNMDNLSKNKRRKMVRCEIEKDVALEDYEEILTGSRFKSLRENANFSIDEIKANAIKKRLLIKGK